MTDLPDGWTLAPGADGHTVASKWFGTHYANVEVPDGNDLAAAVAGVELEQTLRAQAGADADRATAAELRAEADRIDPDVAPAETVPVESVPAEPLSALAPDAAPAAPATEGA